MLFSQRKELGDQLDAWTTMHGVVPNGLSYVTALEQLGYVLYKPTDAIQADWTCRYCGRDYSADALDLDIAVGGVCPSDDCPSNVEMQGRVWQERREPDQLEDA